MHENAYLLVVKLTWNISSNLNFISLPSWWFVVHPFFLLFFSWGNERSASWVFNWEVNIENTLLLERKIRFHFNFTVLSHGILFLSRVIYRLILENAAKKCPLFMFFPPNPNLVGFFISSCLYLSSCRSFEDCGPSSYLISTHWACVIHRILHIYKCVLVWTNLYAISSFPFISYQIKPLSKCLSCK